jgi:hypothetical protein
VVISWKLKFLAIGADGFFKVAIRRHPTETCWSWGLEWNHNNRIVWFFGEQDPMHKIVNSFPSLEWFTIVKEHNYYERYRYEVALDEDKDSLFKI